MTDHLELDDIQHFLLARTPARAARYEFLSFANAEAGRAWLAGIVDKVGTGASVGSDSPDIRWITVGFTWNGLRALGVDDSKLATFPEEFREGLAARAAIVGFTGENHPDHWDGKLADPSLHAIAILFARDRAERDRAAHAHQSYLSEIGGVALLSSLDLEAVSPDGAPREHFGYLDRLSEIPIEGTGAAPTPGSGSPVKAGEFFLGYADESGAVPELPEPRELSRNGSYVAYLRLQEHVGKFRDFLRAQGDTHEAQELVAAKLMGRWREWRAAHARAGEEDPALGADLQRTNDFSYAESDPLWVPRSGGVAHPANEPARHRRQRRAAPADSSRRHVRTAVAGRRARRWRGSRHRRLPRMREPQPTVRVRDERVGERSDVQKSQKRTRSDHRHARRHVRHDHSETARSRRRSRACRRSRRFVAPRTSSCPASERFAGSPARTHRQRGSHDSVSGSADLQPGPSPSEVHARQAALFHLLDVELPVGSEPGRHGARQSFLDDDRGPARPVAELRDARVLGEDVSSGHRRDARAVPSRPASASSRRSARSRDIPSPCINASTRRDKTAARPRAARRHGHADGVRARSSGHRAGGVGGGDRSPSRLADARRNAAHPRAAPRRRRVERFQACARWSTRTTATRWCRASSASAAIHDRS